MVRLQDGRIEVETKTLTAVIEAGFITSLRSKLTGEEFIAPGAARGGPALELTYPLGQAVSISSGEHDRVSVHALSPVAAEVVFHAWEGDGVLRVSADPETGDLLIEPSAYSSRPGVRACRWWLQGLRSDLELVAPFFQGVKLGLDDPLIRDSHWTWPMFWEAGLAILQGPRSGLWVHVRDDRYRFKALKVGRGREAGALGLESEAYGPIDANLAAGGLCWRINVYEGDWRVPAGRYRDWLWRSYGLGQREAARPGWVHDIRLAVCWCPSDGEILDALAERVPPERVLIHLYDWRRDPYDEQYPTYVASDKGRELLAKGREMGFHMMPHFNAVDMDPTHEVAPLVRDFQYRDLETKRVHGWSWFGGRVLPVPESNASRLQYRHEKVMVKIHPGLSMWRSLLARNMLGAAEDLSLEVVFVDVTLTAGNLHNSLVEGTTAPEGMKRLIDDIAGLGRGLVVVGEGLNEITMQGQSFAQAHLFRSWQTNIEGLERTGGCPLNHFLFGRLCRTIGYSGLRGRDEAEELRMRLHEEHGAIPTITPWYPDEIRRPTPAVERALRAAAG